MFYPDGSDRIFLAEVFSHRLPQRKRKSSEGWHKAVCEVEESDGSSGSVGTKVDTARTNEFLLRLQSPYLHEQ